ncbi:hypothetical protein [Bacillus atrophaeus]|uniref:hypothetical protein n=1 Tax=Bacillus atrophaeus TaxID=1452 RepID=UPI000A9F4131|nr:hypothetical protein [Bacillus atrophaeus]MED4806321.1 hypothetical protein [Bacillus atrophaeus]
MLNVNAKAPGQLQLAKVGAFGWTKTKKASKKGFNHAGGCRHSICGNATGAYGSLSASFELPSSFTR